MKLAFFGGNQTSAQVARGLFARLQCRPALVVSLPPRPAGRGQQISTPPLLEWAHEEDFPTFHATVQQLPPLREMGIQLGVVVSFGVIFSPEYIDASPPLINLHFSLLPRHRGASPVAGAILAGDRETGVSVFRIARGVDTGPIFGMRRTPIDAAENAAQLKSRLADLGVDALADVATRYRMGRSPHGIPQAAEEATHSGKIQKQDGVVEPATEPLQTFLRKVRAYQPWPGVRLPTSFLAAPDLQIVAAKAAEGDADVLPAAGELRAEKHRLLLGLADGAAELLQVKSPGKRAMSGAEWGRGAGK